MLIYRLLSRTTPSILWLIALFSSKIRKVLEIRKYWRLKAEHVAGNMDAPIVFHCASLGEYDQALPLIELIEKKYPSQDIIVSFFSPSGYEIIEKKGTRRALLYLPLDTPGNMRDWARIIRPKAVFFARYEYWPNLMYELKHADVPYYFFSSVFRSTGSLFRPSMRFVLRLVLSSEAIFVQDSRSVDVLHKYNYNTVIVAGDTRIDRVFNNVKKGCSDTVLNEWSRDKKVLILGSVHKEDLMVVKACIDWAEKEGWYILLASHEVDKAHIDWWVKETGPARVGLWSQGGQDQKVLILDTVGLLANAYTLGKAAYIGGGFSKSIHNTLEPAAAGIPISFGPKHGRFVEAGMLIEMGAAFPVENEFDVNIWLSQIADEGTRQLGGNKAAEFISSQRGAADKILGYIEAQSFFQ